MVPQFLTTELSASALERREHYADKANQPHIGDLGGDDLKRVIGMPLRKEHGTVDIGKVFGAYMKGDELWITAELYGDTDEGYEAICDFDNGELGGLSLKWQTHFDRASKMVLSKDLLEISVCNRPHFPSCVIAAACSSPVTATVSDSTLHAQSNTIETLVSTHSFVIMQASSQEQGAAAPQSQSEQQAAPASQLQDPASVIQNLTQNVQSQRTENAQLKDQLQKAMEQLNSIQAAKNAEIEERKKEALKDAPRIMQELKHHSGVEVVNPKTVELFSKVLQEPVVNKDSQLGQMITACSAKCTQLEQELAAARKKNAETERAGGMARLEMAAAAASEAIGLLAPSDDRAARAFGASPASVVDQHYGETLQAGAVPAEFLMGNWNTGMDNSTAGLAAALQEKRGGSYAAPPIVNTPRLSTQDYARPQQPAMYGGFHQQQQQQQVPAATLQMAASAPGFQEESDEIDQRRAYQQQRIAQQQLMEASMDNFLMSAAGMTGVEAKGLCEVEIHRDGMAGEQQRQVMA